MRNRTHRARDRQGTVLVAVIVCLGLIGVLIFSALQTSLKQRRQLNRELQMEQTRWLAEAGILHATKLAKSAEELPEKPTTLRPKLDGAEACEISIVFSNIKDKTIATVTARVGIEDRPELQTTKQLTLEVKNRSGE